MRAPWLGDVLRDAGCDVHNVGNPIGRGRDMKTIYGVVGHDTVTPPSRSPEQDDRLIRDGHSNLKGPLYQLGLDRSGCFRWVADGRCNHNGYGTWGNDSIGIGVYTNGGGSPNEPWNGAQQEAFVTGTRAILAYLDLGPSDYWNPRVAGHKETDRGRKQDPYGVDMNAIRRQIADAPAELASNDEDDMTPEDRALLVSIKGELEAIKKAIGNREGFHSLAADNGRSRLGIRALLEDRGIEVEDGP